MLGTGSLFFANFNHIKSSGGFGSSAFGSSTTTAFGSQASPFGSSTQQTNTTQQVNPFGSSTTQSNSGFSTFGSVAQMTQSDAPKANPFGSSTTPGLAC